MGMYLVMVMWTGLLAAASGLYLAVGCLLLCLFDVKLRISDSIDMRHVPIMMLVMILWPFVLGCHLLNNTEQQPSGESPDSGRV